MADEDVTPPQPRYVWPWFVLAGIVLGIILAAVWLTVEIRWTRDRRQAQTQSEVGTNPPPLEDAANVEQLAGYQDTLQGGDAAAGRLVFFYKPEANCAKCHKAGGQGGDNGPDLDGIGSRKTRAYILESILYPNAVINTNYETVIAVLKNNTAVSGTLKSENSAELALNSPDEGLVTVYKNNIKERMKGVSPMPEGIAQLLSKEDLRNLIEFVATLK